MTTKPMTPASMAGQGESLGMSAKTSPLSLATMMPALTARGLSRGDRLAVYLSNRIEVIDLFLACTRLGIIVVPVNVLYRERESGHILHDASPKALVSASTESYVGPGFSPANIWPVDDLAAEAASRPAIVPDTTLDAATPAAIIYTSGTTGTAKGAVITHGALAANARNIVDAWRITSSSGITIRAPSCTEVSARR